MKISHITRLTTGALLLITALLTSAVLWSLSQLDDAFSASADYQQYQRDIQASIGKPINNYLLSGDATLLSDIDSAIASAINRTDHDGRDHSETTVLLQEINAKSRTDLRAAGKLSDPQGLLVNSERELSGELTRLMAYVEDANHASPAARQQYLTLTGLMQQGLLSLSHTRQNYFDNASDESLSTLQHYAAGLQENAQALNNLPRLGVFTETEESDDDLADLMGWSKNEEEEVREDKGDIIIGEIRTLLLRYPRELENAQALIKQKTSAETGIQHLLAQLDDRIAGSADQINRDYATIQNQVYVLLAVCVALIILTGLMMTMLQHQLARILLETSRYIDRLSKGDLRSEFNLASRFDEVHSLRLSIQALHGYFNHLIAQIRHETHQLGTLEHRITQGANHLESIVSQQLTSTEHVVVRMDQLKSSYQQVADNASKTQQATSDAQTLAKESTEYMVSTRRSIDELLHEVEDTAGALVKLQQDAHEISSVLEVIQGFAEQTNLLALNAAIEAARAGEAGRGFAVVADEVRNLASRTNHSATEIKQITDKLNQATATAVERMNKQLTVAASTAESAASAQSRIDSVRQSIENVHSMSSRIAAATDEQTASTTEINTTVTEAAELSRNSSNEADNNQRFAGELSKISTNLSALVQQFS